MYMSRKGFACMYEYACLYGCSSVGNANARGRACEVVVLARVSARVCAFVCACVPYGNARITHVSWKDSEHIKAITRNTHLNLCLKLWNGAHGVSVVVGV